MELKPDLFEGNYYLGVFYTIKADEMNKVMNEKQYSSQTAYDTDLKEVNAVYMDAVPWFEKAYELKRTTSIRSTSSSRSASACAMRRA